VFPDGRPRLLEELSTPLGRSGFVCLPTFADELSVSSGEALAGDCARAIGLAGSLGARSVSLAGLLPARTAYGFTVVRAVGRAGPQVTTGHAATAASVVKTTIAALSAAGRTLEGSTVACVGLGSIGRSSLELLLSVTAGSPRRLVLCDVASRSRQLADLAAELTARGFAGDVTLCSSDASLPAAAYEADLVIGASSADRPILDVGRLRPGTIVVDDSFPHCFDPATAIGRMQRERDILLVGGGLLQLGRTVRSAADDLTTLADASRWLSLRPAGTVASCQLESLLQADRPGLPLVHGLVDIGRASAYWEALADVEVEAAPLHLMAHVLTAEHLDAFSQV
jgi:predicted amino acid dehydrogenase